MKIPARKMKATMPDMKGDRRRSPVCGSRRNPLPGTVPQRMTAVKITVAISAQRRPRRSVSLSPVSASCGTAPAYGPRRGTTTRSVTQVPARVRIGVDTAMK